MDDILSDFSAAATNRLGGMYKCRDEDDCCAICFTSPIADVCHVQPCGHRLGCWSCVEPGLSTCRQCWLCREPVACIVRESTGEMWAVPPPPPSSLEPWDWLESETETEPEPEPGPRTFPAPRSATSLERQVVRRMYVYHHRLFSRHVGANRASGYREITPRVFRNDPALQARARAFLRRELRVFAHMAIHPGLRAARLPEDDIITVHEVEYDVRFFLFMLKKVDLKGSCGSAESYVQQRLARALENMRDRSTVVSLFIHELRAFLMSPHTRLGDWDASVQYDEPPSALAPVPRSDADRPDSTMAFEESCDEETARRRDLSPSNDWRESHDSTTTSEGSGSDRGVARRSFLTPRLSGRGPPNPASLSQRPGYQEAASRTPSTTAEGPGALQGIARRRLLPPRNIGRCSSNSGSPSQGNRSQEQPRHRHPTQPATHTEDYDSPPTFEESVSSRERALHLRAAALTNLWQERRNPVEICRREPVIPARDIFHSDRRAGGPETRGSDLSSTANILDPSYPWEDRRGGEASYD